MPQQMESREAMMAIIMLVGMEYIRAYKGPKSAKISTLMQIIEGLLYFPLIIKSG